MLVALGETLPGVLGIDLSRAPGRDLSLWWATYGCHVLAASPTRRWSQSFLSPFETRRCPSLTRRKSGPSTWVVSGPPPGSTPIRVRCHRSFRTHVLKVWGVSPGSSDVRSRVRMCTKAQGLSLWGKEHAGKQSAWSGAKFLNSTLLVFGAGSV